MKLNRQNISACFSALILLGLTGWDPVKEDTHAEPINRIEDCTVAVGGAAWDENQPFESVPGVEAELAALDLSSLPEQIDISSILSLYRGYIAYALEIDAGELGDTLSRDETLAKGELGAVVLGSLLLGDEVLGIDFSFFRRGFHRYYTCSRSFPATLDDLMAVYGDYASWDYTDVDSVAKCDIRRLRSDANQQVWVAETLVDDQVRETEVLLGGQRDDSAFDFLVYDQDGQLSDRSRFPTLNNGPAVVAAAPYVCTTCHVDTESVESTWAFTIQRPSVGPCAR
ncbi:MAG: hypothetical protein VX519_08730 [Myxococcota bacterium]|nr:hypothetical protein [Myxococcota bacterium]